MRTHDQITAIRNRIGKRYFEYLKEKERLEKLMHACTHADLMLLTEYLSINASACFQHERSEST
jgi:hypothetical protein